MKKKIKMSAEQAQQLYKEHPEWRDTLLSEFTDEELDIDKPFRWEHLKKVDGYFFQLDCSLVGPTTSLTTKSGRGVYPSQADAKKALAEAQLRQLAKYYNDGELEEKWIDWSNADQIRYYAYFDNHMDIETGICCVNTGAICFKNLDGLLKCIKDNQDLWYDYFKVPEKCRTYE